MGKAVVLFIAGSGQFGSGEVLILEYLRLEKDLSFKPVLIFPSEGPLVEQARMDGVEYQVVKSRDYLTDFRNLLHQPFSWVFNLFSFIKVSSIIRQRRVQLVVSLSFMNWTGALAARQEGIRHIWMIREILNTGRSRPRFFWGKWLASRLANDLSSMVILESAAAASLFQRKRTREKARVILPAIDLDFFKSRLTKALEEKPGVKNLVVYWGNWNENRFKRLISFLEQAHNSWMEEKQPEGKIQFFFPGLPVSLVSRFQKLLSASSLNFEIKDAPLCLEPAMWKSAAVAIIIPGFDPLSRLVLEAGLARVPVLVDSGIPEELVINFRTGFVYDEQRAEEMSKLLEKLMEDEKLRQEVGEEAEKHITNNFPMDRWKSEFGKIIKDSLV